MRPEGYTSAASMEPTFNAPSLVTLLGASHAIVFAVALAASTRRWTAGTWLAGLLIMLALPVLNGVLQSTGYVLVIPHAAQLHAPLQFLIGPLLLFYVEALIGRRLFPSFPRWWHALPAVAVALWLVPFYVQDAAQKRAFLESALQEYPLAWRIRQALLIAHMVAYLAPMAMLLRSTRLLALDPARRRWATNTVLLFLAAFVIAATRYVVDYSVNSVLLVPLLITGFVYTTGYAALANPAVLKGEAADPIGRPKYAGSTLTAERAGQCAAEVRQLMTSQHLYRDPSLSLNRLARRVGLSPQHVSQVLNERLGAGFSDFVNGYRVAEVSRALRDPGQAHLSIAALAEAAGFSSKSAFNAAFRRHTGTTPAAFRRSNGADLPAAGPER